MELEIESVCQEILIHDVEFVDVVGAVGLGFDVVKIGGEPVGAAGDLAHWHLVHQTDHELDRDVLCGVLAASGEGLDEAAAGTRLGEPDRCYFEGGARGFVRGGLVLAMGERYGHEGDGDGQQVGPAFNHGTPRH